MQTRYLVAFCLACLVPIACGVRASDDIHFDRAVARDPVHVHDIQATILHLLGFDHHHLTYRFQGRDFRLTDVHGNIVKEILA